LLNTLRPHALPVVIDYFSEGQSWYLVMDFVPGEVLAAYLARSRVLQKDATTARWPENGFRAAAEIGR
jgi:hypothetical protein